MRNAFKRVFTSGICFLLSTSAMAGQAASGEGGGNSGGGGSIQVGDPVSPQTIRSYLEKVQIPLQMTFSFVSVATWNESKGYFGTLGGSENANMGELIYQRSPDIFAKIKMVKPDIVDDGSCRINGVSMDGAAYTNPDRVCLDATRIASNPKVGELNYALISLALAAHEYSHLVGTNEDQANLLQKFIKDDIGMTLANKYRYVLYESTQHLDEISGLLQNVLDDLSNHKEWTETCMDLTMATTSMENGPEMHDNLNGLGVFSRAQFDAVLPRWHQSETFVFACKNNPQINALRDQVFGDKNTIVDSEFVKRMHPKSSGGIVSNTAMIRRMNYLDSKAVESDVRDLLDVVALLKSELPK